MLDFINAIKEKAKILQKTIILAETDDERILLAADKILSQRLAKLILIGNKQEILQNAEKLNINLNNAEFIDNNDQHLINELGHEYFELRKHKDITIDEALEQVKDPNYFANMLLYKNRADGVVSGSISTTADTIRPALQIIKTHEASHRVSSFFFMQLKDRLLIFADCAINICPNAEELAHIAIDTANNAKLFNIDPKVALLSFSTKGSGKHELVDKVKKAVEIAQELEPDLVLDGEMQVDAALLPEVCHRKCKNCNLHGKANVLIFPDLQSGNIAYKLVERLAKADAIGPITQGLNKPVNDLSRGCDVDDIVDVVAITAVQANMNKGE